MTRRGAPPRLAELVAGLRTPRAEREFVLGDLDEDFRAIAAVRGVAAARRWYWGQTFRNLVSRNGEKVLVLRDFLFSLRALRRAPAASAAAVLTYALGIGANVAIFSVAWPILVAPLPFPDEDRLVAIWLTYQGAGSATEINPLSMGDFVDIRGATQLSAAAVSGRVTATNLTTAGGEPRLFALGHVTPSYFAVMGVAPLAGRTLQPGDAQRGVRPIVISERTWRTAFGGSTGILGQTVRLDDEPFQIAGVVPSTTGYGLVEADGWAALDVPPSRERQRAYYLHAVGRLAPGVSIAQANDELAAIMARAAEDFPDANRHLSARAFSLREEFTGPVRRSLLLLAGGALLLLVVAGVNLAGLLLARNVERAREIGIRQALGASRGRLVAQMVLENTTLAAVGGLLALVIAFVTLRVLAGVAPAGTLHPDRVTPAWIVLLFTIALALACGVLIALIPAWTASKPAAGAWTSRGATMARGAARARALVIMSQVALTVLLLVVASLVGSSLFRVLQVDPGFHIPQGLVADVKLPDSRYDSAAAATRFFDALIARVEALPGAQSACVINQMPLEPAMGSMTWVAEGGDRMVSSNPKSVSDGCFAVLGVPLLRGRLFRPRERDRSVVVSQSMARALWPDGADPIGRRIHMGLRSGDLWTIVGVAGDVRNHSLETRAVRQVWMPEATGFYRPQRLVIRTDVPAVTLAQPVRDALRAIDPHLALANIRTIDDVRARTTAPRRFMSMLLASFALVALALSAVGIYGLLAHAVGQRTKEIGVRRALGATGAHITRIVAGALGVAVAAGAAAGLAGAWALSSVVASLLYEVSATDPRVYAAVTLFVCLVVALSAWPPARRAARIQPVLALKE